MISNFFEREVCTRTVLAGEAISHANRESIVQLAEATRNGPAPGRNSSSSGKYGKHLKTIVLAIRSLSFINRITLFIYTELHSHGPGDIDVAGNGKLEGKHNDVCQFAFD